VVGSSDCGSRGFGATGLLGRGRASNDEKQTAGRPASGRGLLAHDVSIPVPAVTAPKVSGYLLGVITPLTFPSRRPNSLVQPSIFSWVGSLLAGGHAPCETNRTPRILPPSGQRVERPAHSAR